MKYPAMMAAILQDLEIPFEDVAADLQQLIDLGYIEIQALIPKFNSQYPCRK